MRNLLRFKLPILAGFVLVICVFWVYYISIVRDRGDSRYVLHLAKSIITEKNTDLDEYKWLIEKEGIYKTRTFLRNNHIYSIYPIGTTLLTVPFVAVYDWYSTYLINPRGVDKQVVLVQTDIMDSFLAALFVALAILFIYCIGLTIGPWYLALVASVGIAFGTSAWTSAARTLWSHGPSMLMLALGLLLLIKARRYSFLAVLAQLPLAYAFYIRPTNILPLTAFLIFIFVKFRKLWLYALCVDIAVLLPLWIYNWRIFGNVLSPFYYPGGISMGPYTHTFQLSGEGLLGLLVSPNRGLFIFSSFLLFSLIGILFLIKGRKASLFEYLLMMCIILHWILISTYQGWWGGWGFGQRYFTDILPIFAYFLFIFFRELTLVKNMFIKGLNWGMFGVMALLSIWIYHSGSSYIATMYWDGYPTNIDFHHERVWDFKDLQFLRR